MIDGILRTRDELNSLAGSCYGIMLNMPYQVNKWIGRGEGMPQNVASRGMLA